LSSAIEVDQDYRHCREIRANKSMLSNPPISSSSSLEENGSRTSSSGNHR